MTYEERQRRLDRARFAIQAELQIGLMVVILTGFMAVMLTGFPFVAAPHETPRLCPPSSSSSSSPLRSFRYSRGSGCCDSHDRTPRRASGVGDTTTEQRSDRTLGHGVMARLTPGC